MAKADECTIGSRVAYETYKPNIFGQFVAVYEYGYIIGHMDGKAIVQREDGQVMKAKPESLGDIVGERCMFCEGSGDGVAEWQDELGNMQQELCDCSACEGKGWV